MPRRPKIEARQRFYAAMGRAIRKGRLGAGLTQPAAASALGVPLWTYRSWEYGTREAPAEVKARIVELWGAPASKLAVDDKQRCPTCGKPY